MTGRGKKSLRFHAKVNLGLVFLMVIALVFMYAIVGSVVRGGIEDLLYRIYGEVLEHMVWERLTPVLLSLTLLTVVLFGAVMFLMHCMGRNIEEQSIAEERFRLIYDNMPMPVAMVGRNYGLLHCNKEAVRMFEMKNSEEFITTIKNRAPEHQPDGSVSHTTRIERYEQAFREGIVRFEWVTTLPSGELLPLEMTFIRVEFQNAPHLLAFMRDMRDLNELRKAQEDMRKAIIVKDEMTRELEDALREAQVASLAKGNFLSNMSHEIRTPLNAITGMVAIGKSATDLEKKNYALGKIENASSHLLGVVNDVLDMSKIEANKFELSFVDFSFEQLVEKVISVVEPLMGEKNQRLALELDSRIPGLVLGDDQRLAQVMTNLLSNAVKFTPAGGDIGLATRLVEESGGSCVIQVEVVDTGIGIEPGTEAQLFNPFTQADSGTSRRYGGTGLGLPISKRIVEMMGGNIWLESIMGEGSRFSFTVRVGCGDGGGKAPGKAPLQADLSCLRGRRVLLTEDVEINREIVVGLLEVSGLEIECAVNGLEAVNMFGASPERYDLILMDVQMPEMDGYKAARKIREMDTPKARDIPIVALTANVFKDNVSQCIEAGMNDHIGKPINYERLVEKLLTYLPPVPPG